MPEAWLRGPVDGIDPGLMPAAHCLIDALEDMERAAAPLSVEQLWRRPGDAPSVAFHLEHVVGSIDRLLTYAKGESLTPAQLAAIPAEGDPGRGRRSADALLADVRAAVGSALETYRAMSHEALAEPRAVGRARLPSTVLGLLFHAAEHSRRHAGQVVATATIVRGIHPGADDRIS